MKKILIVEDHPLYRKALERFMQIVAPNSLVFMTDTVSGGLEFITLNTMDITLVITDWNLPDGLGRTIITEAQKQSIPSILTSTEDEPTNHGANLFIPKMEFDVHIRTAIKQLSRT